jgi:hypothetical protein
VLRFGSRACPHWRPRLALVLVIGCFLGSAALAQGAIPWTGAWTTEYGTVQLTQNGSQVTGRYGYDPGLSRGTIKGTVSGATLVGKFDARASGGPTEVGTFEWRMSADGLAFTGSWLRSGTQEGGSWTGTRTSPLAPSGTFSRKRCKSVNGIVVAAQGIGCTRARKIAEALLKGHPPQGYRCVRNRPKSWAKSPRKRNRILWICGKAPGDNPNNEAQVVSVIPKGAETCDELVYQGRRYVILALKVTCRYARGNTLRAFRGEDPIIAEFVPSGESPKWSCRTWLFVSGVCVKPNEGRALAWELKR